MLSMRNTYIRLRRSFEGANGGGGGCGRLLIVFLFDSSPPPTFLSFYHVLISLLVCSMRLCVLYFLGLLFFCRLDVDQ